MRQTDRTHRQRVRQTYRDTETKSETDRQRQRVRQTDRDTETKNETDRQRHRDKE